MWSTVKTGTIASALNISRLHFHQQNCYFCQSWQMAAHPEPGSAAAFSPVKTESFLFRRAQSDVLLDSY